MDITSAGHLKTKLFFDDKALNEWLSNNPHKQIVDIKMSANGAHPTILVIFLT